MKTLAFIALLLMASPSWAIGLCGTREEMAQALKNKYSEMPVEAGTVNSTVLVELYVSEDQSTWTILATTSGKRTCIIAAGQNWEFSKPSIKGKRT